MKTLLSLLSLHHNLHHYNSALARALRISQRREGDHVSALSQEFQLTGDLIAVLRTQTVHWLQEVALSPAPTNHIAELLTVYLECYRTGQTYHKRGASVSTSSYIPKGPDDAYCWTPFRTSEHIMIIAH